MGHANLFLISVSRSRVLASDPLKQIALTRKAAGLEPLVTGLDVLARLENQETPEDVVRELVADAEAWATRDLKKALDRHQRAHAVKQLRQELSAGVRAFPPAISHTERFELVAGPVADVLERLTATVPLLPDDALALDPTANIDAGTTAELAEVRDLVQRLGNMVGWLPADGGNRGISRDLIAVIDIPDVGASRVRRRDGLEVNPDPRRATLRSFAEAQSTDSDAALLGVLRGDYEGVTARLAKSRAEMADRQARVATALQAQWVDQ